MGNGLSGIRYNIEKADRKDRKAQNLAPYINADTLKNAHNRVNNPPLMP